MLTFLPLLKLLEKKIHDTVNLGNDLLVSTELLLDKINQAVLKEKPSVDQMIKLCQVSYDYCEIVNDWFLWESWVKRYSLLSIDGSGAIYAGLGRAAEERGDLDQALILHEAGIRNSQTSINNSLWEGLNWHGKGIVLMRLGDSDATSSYKNAISIFIRERHIYHLYCALCDLGGSYYLKIEDAQKEAHKSRYFSNILPCLFFYSASVAIQRAKNIKWDLSRTYYSLGFALLYTKLLKKLSMSCFEKAEKYGDTLGAGRYKSLAYYGKGCYLYNNCQYDDALEKFVGAHNTYLKQAKEMSDKYYFINLFNICYMQAHTYLKLDRISDFKIQLGALLKNYYEHIGNIHDDRRKINALKRLCDAMEKHPLITCDFLKKFKNMVTNAEHLIQKPC